MNLTIKTPEKNVFQGPVEYVNIPSIKGPFQILKGHAPIITQLNEQGTITYKETNGKVHNIKSKKGITEANNNKIIILLYE
jgi:F-type H+-transporting ATPase subunit epsilon